MGMIMRSTSAVAETISPAEFANAMVLAMFHHSPIYLWNKDSQSAPILVGNAKLRVVRDASHENHTAHLVVCVGPSFITARLASKFTSMNRVLADKDLKVLDTMLTYCLVTTTPFTAHNIFVPWMEGQKSMVSPSVMRLKSLPDAFAFYAGLFAGCTTQYSVWSKFHEHMALAERRESVFPVWMRVDERWRAFVDTLMDRSSSFFPPLPQCSLLGSTEDEILEDYAAIRPALVEFPKYWCGRCRKKAALTTIEGTLRISAPALVEMFRHQAALRWNRDETSGALRVWGKRPLSVPFLRAMYVAFDQDGFEEEPSLLKSCMFGCYRSRRWTVEGPNVPDADADERVNTMLLHDAVRPGNVRKLVDCIESGFIAPLVRYIETHASVVPTVEIANKVHDGLWSLVLYMRFCNDCILRGLSRGLEETSIFELERIDTSAPVYTSRPRCVPVACPIPGVPTAILSTGANVVSGAAWDAIDAEMVDMETWALVRAAQTFDVPLVALRGVSDGRAELKALEDWTSTLHHVDENLAEAWDRLGVAAAGESG